MSIRHIAKRNFRRLSHFTLKSIELAAYSFPCDFADCLTQNWLNKPDLTPGWSSFFLSRGYELYIIDQTYRGRSPAPPPSTGANLTFATYSAELLQQRFTAPKLYSLWPQASLASQWPGRGTRGDPYFDAYYSSTVQFLSGAAAQQLSVQAAGAALLDRIGKPVILLAHSQGGIMPWLIADARPALSRAIVALEPSGPPFREAVFGNASARAYGLTDAPLTYSPPVTNPAADLARATKVPPAGLAGGVPCTLQAESAATPPRSLPNLRRVPVLLVTAEASYHVPYDYCTVLYLRQAGVPAEHWYLKDKGVRGNGHLMFLERNSDRVAAVIEVWIAKQK